MYEIGKVYIWQNQVRQYAKLNGTECTVVDEAKNFLMPDGRTARGQLTDTPGSNPANRMFAERGDLRPKNPPSGEQLINEMFYVNVTA